MAEEGTDSLVTPEKDELNTRDMSKYSARSSHSLSNGRNCHARNLRASIGSYYAGYSSMRNSNSSQNTVPHYLRASTGSCHDFCKYGRKHLFEEKARKPLLKRNAKPLPDGLNPVQMIASGEQKKEKVVNHKPPTADQNHSPDPKSAPDTKSYSPESQTSLDKKKVVKQKPLKNTKNHSPDLKPSPDTNSYLRKSKMSLNAKAYSPGQNVSSGDKAINPKYKPSSTEKSRSPDPPEIIKSVCFPSKKVEVPVQQGSSTDDKMLIPEKKTTYLFKQRTSPVKSKPVKVKPSSSSDKSDGIHGKGRRNSDAESDRNMTATKAYVKKVLATPAAAVVSPEISLIKTSSIKSRKAGNLKLMSPLKDRNRIRIVKTKLSNNEKVSEKTLHVIEMENESSVSMENENNVSRENENNVFESIPDDQVISSLSSPSSAKFSSHAKPSSLSSHEEDNEETEFSGGEAGELTSDNNGSLEMDKVPPVEVNHNKMLRKSRVVVSDDKHCSPVKLKFRSGKVVDPQSDNNGPRRLRFRRARVLGPEVGKGELRKKTFKKAVNNDVAGAELSSEKVVLKHQDVQGKKDAQGLFNNVIEETASKLVESRKSKVKALVGAFETVISLQEIKPSSQVVN